MARYEQIADDLRRRITRGELGGPGDRIPTLSDLMDEYGIAGVQTIRSAQAVLVDEGVLETRHGAGVFIVRVPTAADVEIGAVVDDLEDVQRTLTRLGRQLTALGATPPPSPATPSPGRGTWRWAEWHQCNTCGAEGGSTRGWVDAADVDDEYDSLEHCRSDGHDWCNGVGLDQGQEHATAAAVESWWEHRAQTEEATRMLLAGALDAATWHATRAHDLADEHDAFAGFSLAVTPATSTSPA